MTAFPTVSEASDFTWTGAAGDLEFTTAGNWTPMGVPGPGDTADFPSLSGELPVHVTASGGGTVDVGRIILRRDVRFWGDPLGFWGVGGGDSILVQVVGVDATFKNDLVLGVEGVIQVLQLLGPPTLAICGSIGDDGVGLGPTLQPTGATIIRLDGQNTYGGPTRIGSESSQDAQGVVLVTSAGAFGTGPVSFVNGGNLHIATPDLPNDIEIAGNVRIGVAETMIPEMPTGKSGRTPVTCDVVGTGVWASTLSGVISGSETSSLRIEAVPDGQTGTLTLAGSNVLDSPIFVNPFATLRVSNPGALGTTTRGTFLSISTTLELAGGITVVDEELTIAALNGIATLRSADGVNTWTGPVVGDPRIAADVLAERLVLSGVFHISELLKTGTGVLQIDQDFQQGSSALVADGTLLLNADFRYFFMTVASGATLGGTGSVTVVNGIDVAGALAPGDGVGTLSLAGGDVTFDTASSFAVEIDGASGDLLEVLGNPPDPRMLSLGPGTFLSLTANEPMPGVYTIIETGPDVSLEGTFEGLPEGAQIGVFTISYAGGDGNDVVLTATASDVTAPDARAALRLVTSPNPGSPSTTVIFSLRRPGAVELGVYDVSGRLVRTLLARSFRPAGHNEVLWDGRSNEGRLAAPGLYLLRLQAGDAVTAHRHLLVR